MSTASVQRILVIDDDAAIGHEVCDALSLRNFEAVYADGILQARTALANDDEIGIVFVDYHLGNITGSEVIDTLTKEFPRHLAFIIMTGDGTQGVAVDAVRAHAVDFLSKPLDGKSIAAAVQRALAARDSQMGQDNVGASFGLVCESFLQERLRTKNIQKQWRDLVSDLAAGSYENCKQLLQREPVDVAVVLRRLMSAMDRTALDRKIQIKLRIPGALPFLYADAAGFSLGIRDIAVFMTASMLPGNSLTITTIREEQELVVSFHLQAANFAFETLDVLTDDLARVAQNRNRESKMTLLGPRIMAELHRSRFRTERRAADDIFVRLFVPLANVETKTVGYKTAVSS